MSNQFNELSNLSRRLKPCILLEPDYDMPYGQIRVGAFFIRPIQGLEEGKYDVFTAAWKNYPQMRSVMTVAQIIDFVTDLRREQ